MTYNLSQSDIKKTHKAIITCINNAEPIEPQTNTHHPHPQQREVVLTAAVVVVSTNQTFRGRSLAFVIPIAEHQN